MSKDNSFLCHISLTAVCCDCKSQITPSYIHTKPNLFGKRGTESGCVNNDNLLPEYNYEVKMGTLEVMCGI